MKRHNPEKRAFRGKSYKTGRRVREMRAAQHLKSHHALVNQ